MEVTKFKPLSFYHRTMTVFLDDNRNFLNAMELQFNSIFDMKTFTKADQALKEINNMKRETSDRGASNYIDTNTNIDGDVNFEIKKFARVMYDKTRFKQIAVLVVDYEMPELNGIDFCELAGKNIYKIMLTAEADKDTAIRAFNSGIIDKFILKTSSTLFEEIEAAIQELTYRYFERPPRGYSQRPHHTFDTVFDSELYQDLFQSVLQSSDAVEYYMVDNSGSYLFLDKNANTTWLFVKSNAQIQEQLELLQGYDIPDEFITSVSKKEEILFLLSEGEYKLPTTEWRQYLFKTKKLDHSYYYCVTNNYATSFLDWGRVKPYETIK